MKKEGQEFKERCLALNCIENLNCKKCPLDNNFGDCELFKFKQIVKERFKPKSCPACGKEIKDAI